MTSAATSVILSAYVLVVVVGWHVTAPRLLPPLVTTDPTPSDRPDTGLVSQTQQVGSGDGASLVGDAARDAAGDATGDAAGDAAGDAGDAGGRDVVYTSTTAPIPAPTTSRPVYIDNTDQQSGDGGYRVEEGYVIHKPLSSHEAKTSANNEGHLEQSNRDTIPPNAKDETPSTVQSSQISLTVTDPAALTSHSQVDVTTVVPPPAPSNSPTSSHTNAVSSNAPEASRLVEESQTDSRTIANSPTASIANGDSPTPPRTIGDSPTPPRTIGDSPSPPRTIGDSPTPPRTIGDSPSPPRTIGDSPTASRTTEESQTASKTIGDSPTPSPKEDPLLTDSDTLSDPLSPISNTTDNNDTVTMTTNDTTPDLSPSTGVLPTVTPTSASGSRRSDPPSSSDADDQRSPVRYSDKLGRPVFRSDEERLLDYLFREYNPSARPVINSSKSVQVSMQFSLMHFQELVSTFCFTQPCFIDDYL